MVFKNGGRVGKDKMTSRIIAIVIALLSTISVTTVHAAKEEKADEKTPSAETPQAKGEIVCEANITYSWKRKPPPVPLGNKNSVTPPPPPPEMPTLETLYQQIGERGMVEVDVKNRLTTRLPSAQAEAMQHCAEAHENQTLCISKQLKLVTKDYQLLDFAARKTLLSAVTADCETQAGDCLSSKSGPVYCFENRSPDALPATSETEGAEGADKKPADKKKK